MAIVTNPIIGRSRNGSGTMVFQTVFGQNVIRSRPLMLKDRKSSSQLLIRSNFSIISSCLSKIKRNLSNLYGIALQDMSAWSKSHQLILGGYPTGRSIFDPLLELCSIGSGPFPGFYASISKLHGDPFALWNWSVTGYPPELIDALQVEFVILNLTKFTAFIDHSPEFFNTGTAPFNPPPGTELADFLLCFSGVYVGTANGFTPSPKLATTYVFS
jgi:hypothetical protein